MLEGEVLSETIKAGLLPLLFLSLVLLSKVLILLLPGSAPICEHV